MVDRAGQAVAHQMRIRADRVQSQRALPGHLLQALGKEVFGSGIHFVQSPLLPVRQKPMQLVAEELGIFRPLRSRLLEVPDGSPQIHRTANPVFRQEHGLVSLGQRAQRLDDVTRVRHARIAMLVAEQYSPTRRSLDWRCCRSLSDGPSAR